MFKTSLLIMTAFFSINAYASVLERSARSNLTQQEELRTVAGNVLKVKYGRLRNSGAVNISLLTFVSQLMAKLVKRNIPELY